MKTYNSLQNCILHMASIHYLFYFYHSYMYDLERILD